MDALELSIHAFDVFVITNSRHQGGLVEFLDRMMTQKDALESLEVPVHQVEDFDVPDSWSQNEPFFVVLSVSSDWIFGGQHIERFGPNFFNLHGSLLPSLRGGGGLTWAVLSQVRESGVTIHFVDTGIDTGEILMQRRFAVGEGLRLEPLIKLHRDQARQLLKDFFGKAQSTSKEIKSDEILESKLPQSYWPRISTETNGWIDWSWPASAIVDFIRAFGPPFGGASTHFRGERIRLIDAGLESANAPHHPFQWGIIYDQQADRLIVAANGGSIHLSALRIGDHDVTPDRSWLGERLYTPQAILEESLTSRFRTRRN